MNKETVKNIALILLAVIAVFSTVRYAGELRLKLTLQNSLLRAQKEVADLTQEKQKLLQELGKEKELSGQLALKNGVLKAYLTAAKERISRLFRDKANANARLSILKAENRVLIDSHKRLYLENERLKATLNSVVELRKAIRELKSRKRGDKSFMKDGNRGYLLRQGKSTSQAKIVVMPAP